MGAEPRVLQHVGVDLLLHARDALDPASDVNVTFATDDALRGQGNGLQARRAKTVHRHPRDRYRAAGAQSDLAGDVGAVSAFREGTTHDHVFHFSGIDAGTLNRVLHHMAAQRGTVGQVERALPAFGQRGAGGRHNYG
ncbi:hypothetical protein GALL_540290 [mine drainage metagenome]|uniref:Uncharacterized protein n=1 Tax=mine drainage metagenome TaxID=410659 RepID=A0A1J5PGP1_9ZZZZ